MSARLRPWHRVLLPVLAAFALALGAVAAAGARDQLSSARAPYFASAPGNPAAAACHPEASSLRPPPGPPQVTSSPTVATIRKRGYLKAGVDQNTYHFGFLNSLDGHIEGFDIDMIKAVARAIFGDANSNHLHLIAISDAQREPAIWSGAVDIVAHTMTILCSRLKTEEFSSVYYLAYQRVLVLKGSPWGSLADLHGHKVCATAGSDSIAAIVKYRAIPVPVKYWTDCLVLLQQGDVDAISTDDSILYGLEAQDPWTKVVGPLLNEQPYGLAISNKHPDFVQFVNAVLAQLRSDGQWVASYVHWIAQPGQPVLAPPRARYRD